MRGVVTWEQGAHLLGYLLEGLGLQAAALHSQLKQHDRLAALHRFKSGNWLYLVWEACILLQVCMAVQA